MRESSWRFRRITAVSSRIFFADILWPDTEHCIQITHNGPRRASQIYSWASSSCGESGLERHKTAVISRKSLRLRILSLPRSAGSIRDAQESLVSDGTAYKRVPHIGNLVQFQSRAIVAWDEVISLFGDNDTREFQVAGRPRVGQQGNRTGATRRPRMRRLLTTRKSSSAMGPARCRTFQLPSPRRCSKGIREQSGVRITIYECKWTLVSEPW